jgi:hypothetical protein
MLRRAWSGLIWFMIRNRRHATAKMVLNLSVLADEQDSVLQEEPYSTKISRTSYKVTIMKNRTCMMRITKLTILSSQYLAIHLSPLCHCQDLLSGTYWLEEEPSEETIPP